MTADRNVQISGIAWFVQAHTRMVFAPSCADVEMILAAAASANIYSNALHMIADLVPNNGSLSTCSLYLSIE